jgi:hypothetical protein
MYLTLDSRDAVPSPTPGVLRFPLASPLRHVSRVEWLTFESCSANTIALDGESFFFSEELRSFEAVVPQGLYTIDTLRGAVEAAMACAVAKQDGEGPSNRYEVRMLPESKRVCIAARGREAFAVHAFRESVAVQQVHRLVQGDWQATFFSTVHEPMARGSIVELFRPSAAATTAQVLHASGTTVVVRRLEGPELVSSNDWTMRPLSSKTVLPELLGLGGRDQASSERLPIVACSGLDNFVVGTRGPHGLVPGDRVVVDGVDGLCGTEAVVDTVVSEQQVSLRVSMERGEPCKLTLAFQGRVFELVALPRVVARDKDEVTVEVEAASLVLMKYIEEARWTDVKMLPPYPSVEWGGGRVAARKGTDAGKLLFRLRLPHPRVTTQSCMTRMAVVGVKSMVREQRVLLVRLWMGLTEAYGVSSNRLNVFGRKQVKGDGVLTSTDHSVVGVAEFRPFLERASFVEVSFLTPQGQAVPVNILGEYSMLLRIEALP